MGGKESSRPKTVRLSFPTRVYWNATGVPLQDSHAVGSEAGIAAD
ncbi:MAG: hypothetical protein AAFV88_20015 [Planctomycetota bacterium]